MTNLTPELIQQYLEGSLTPEIQYQVERYLLDHPFEAEAMEGVEFIGTTSFESDVANLKSKLRSGKKETKVIPMWRQYWKMAAVITLLIVSTILILEMSRVPDLATNELALNDDKLDKRTDEIVELDTQSAQSSKKVLSEDSDQMILEGEQLNVLEQEKQVSREKEEQPQIATIEVEEVSEQYEPIADAEIEQREEEILDEEVTTEKEQAILSMNDQPEVTNAASGAARTSMTKPPVSTNTQTLSKRTIIAKEEERSSKSAVQSISKKRKSDRKDEAYPVDGFEAYQNYLKSSLQYPQKAVDNQVSGKVIVEFTVTKDGQLEAFEVIEGIGSGCDEEAIRLIKEGPKWKPGTKRSRVIDEKIRLEVIFNR